MEKSKYVEFEAVLPIKIKFGAWVPCDVKDTGKWIEENKFSCIKYVKPKEEPYDVLFNKLNTENIEALKEATFLNTISSLIDLVGDVENMEKKVFLETENHGLLPFNSANYYVEDEIFYFEGYDPDNKGRQLTAEVFNDIYRLELCAGDWMDEDSIGDCELKIHINNGVELDDSSHCSKSIYYISEIEMMEDRIILKLEKE